MASIIKWEEILTRFMSNSYNCLIQFFISARENKLLLNKALVVSGMSRSGAIRMLVSKRWERLRESAIFEFSSSINHFTQTEASMTNISETPVFGELPLHFSSPGGLYGVDGQLPWKHAAFWLYRAPDVQSGVQPLLNSLSFLSPPAKEFSINRQGCQVSHSSLRGTKRRSDRRRNARGSAEPSWARPISNVVASACQA